MGASDDKYIVINGIYKDDVTKQEGYYYFILGAEPDFQFMTSGVESEEVLVNQIVKGYRLKPLNFSIDRHNKIKQDCGSFKRFNGSSMIVIAELVSHSGVIKGYRLYSCAYNNFLNATRKDIIERAGQTSEPYLQNAVIRNGTVNCYPNHPFVRIKIGDSSAVKKGKKTKVASVKTSRKKTTAESEYTKEQLNEIYKCREHGIGSAEIENPKLSPKQMRVLWVAKGKGALVQYFANPNLSVDVMKFYADRLINRDMANECALLLQHPELTVDELSELYQCVASGIQYRDLIGKNSETIYVKRIERDKKFWGIINMDVSAIRESAIEKGFDALRKLKGFV